MPQIGCSETLSCKAAGLAHAGQDLADLLRRGAKLPSRYTVQGQEFTVGRLALSPKSSDNHSALNNALKAAGPNTLLILPPSDEAYRYGTNFSWPSTRNLYLIGYGATLRATREGFVRHELGGNDQGVLGLRFIGPSAGYTRWPERWEASDKTTEAAKFDRIGDQDNDSSSSWIQCYNKSNIIVRDCIAEGAMRGFIRCYYSTECLFEKNIISRTHSDSIHIVKNSHRITARGNAIYDAGDDAISVVSYAKASEGGDSANTSAPSGILIEDNRVKGGRARGLTVVGGEDIVIRRNYVTDITLGGVRLGPANAHKTFDVRNVVVEDNVFQRCGLKRSGDPNSGIVALLASSSRACRDITVRNNVGRTFGEYYASSFVRKKGSIGNLQESGNVLEKINA